MAERKRQPKVTLERYEACVLAPGKRLALAETDLSGHTQQPNSDFARAQRRSATEHNLLVKNQEKAETAQKQLDALAVRKNILKAAKEAKEAKEVIILFMFLLIWIPF